MKLIRFLVIGFTALFFSANAIADEIRVGLKSEPSSIDPHYHNLGPNNAFAHRFSAHSSGAMKINNIILTLQYPGSQLMIQLGSSSFARVSSGMTEVALPPMT